MIIENLINNDFKPFGLHEPLEKFKVLGNDYKLSHIPVVEKGIFKGVLNEKCFEECDNKVLTELLPHLEKFSLTPSQTIFQAINLFRLYDTNFIAIVSEDEKYLGYITVEDVLTELSKSPTISESGAILIIETNLKDYSASEISKIVESNNTRIYGMNIHRFIEDRVQILLKISDANVDSVIETFERFNYLLIFKSSSTQKDDFISDRYHQFMNFLDL
ncbi:MAG: CBS domain-containing protein [Flavobacteriales bacterium]